jgi:hypothetical protein
MDLVGSNHYLTTAIHCGRQGRVSTLTASSLLPISTTAGLVERGVEAGLGYAAAAGLIMRLHGLCLFRLLDGLQAVCFTSREGHRCICKSPGLGLVIA